MLDHPTPPSSTSRVKRNQVEDAFPTPPRCQPSDTSFRVNGRASPATAELMALQRAQSTPPGLTKDSQFRSLTRGSVGDLPPTRDLEQSWSRFHLSKKRSQYYSDAFAYREPSNTAKERVVRDSIILVEVKLSCCVRSQKDAEAAKLMNTQVESQQEFMVDLSFRLSEIYQRPASCIMVMVSTEVAILIGGNCGPAYHLTVTALPSEIAATKNKRAAHLLQDFMQDSMKIKSKRGVVQFVAVVEENLATNGVTALQEIEQLERLSAEEEGVLRAFSRQTRRSKKSSLPFMSDRATTPTMISRSGTPSPFAADIGGGDSRSTCPGGKEEKRTKRRRSILAFFKMGSL